MKKYFFWIGLVVILGSMITGCQKNNDKERYESRFFDVFDTVVSVSLRGESEREAEEKFQRIHQRFKELHELYDIYNEYPGLVNMKTVNDHAGKGPIKVPKDLYELLEFSLTTQREIPGKVNVAFGSVLELWHNERDAHQGEDHHEGDQEGKLPDPEKLQEAAKHTSIENVVLHPETYEVEILDPDLRLDVGAIAKGFAVEKIAQEWETQGETSLLLSAGGNVRLVGNPGDPEKPQFIIGIQNPEVTEDGEAAQVLLAVKVNDTSVVTSGDYQRYYTVDGVRYHHLIDPDTLYPADHFRQVTVITKNSALADYLSTDLFLTDLEKGKALVESLPDTEALWVLQGNEKVFSSGMESLLREEDR